MPAAWPALDYDEWRDTCDTLHAHTQVLGKLAAVLAPPEPQLQHAALRLTARGWETTALPAPDGSGAFLVALDLHRHEAVVEHSDGRAERIPLTPDRPVGEVTRELLMSVRGMAGDFEVELDPQEVPWTARLDEDEEHRSYDAGQVETYFAAADGSSTPVNAWWGSFDLAVNLFSGMPAEPPSGDFIMRNAMDSQEVAVGWWPGDPRYGKAALYAYAHPAPPGFEDGEVGPDSARWDGELGEYVLDWSEVCASPDPFATALGFARSAFQHACLVCGWDPALAASAESDPPPVS